MPTPRTPEIDQLYQDVLNYRSTKDFHELLDFIAKFRQIAPYNAMLIHMQKPGSVYVATARDWQDRFHRNVKPGARPLLILKPFGPVSFVFEYNDTEGEPLPNELVNPFLIDSPINPQILDMMLHGLAYEGIEAYQQEYGTDLAGRLEYTGRDKHLPIRYQGKNLLIRSHYAIILNKHHGDAEKFATLLHELGHYYCGHLNHGWDLWPPNRTSLSKEQQEFEAETISWLVCKRNGIENPSARYLSNYLEHNQFIPSVSIYVILKAVGKIEDHLSGTAKPRNELLVKTDQAI